MTEARLAELLDVDPKTVQRWVTRGRTPHRVTATKAAEVLGVPLTWLWPHLTGGESAVTAGEVVAFFAHRSQVPSHVWLDQVLRATSIVHILTYAGLFLVEENPEIIGLLRHKAANGVRVRIALGDPETEELRLRGREEGMPHEIPARVRMSLHYFAPLIGAPGIDFRLHRTTLYNSFYRFDNDMLINQHAYGVFGYRAPVLHIRRTPRGDLFETYEDSLSKAWAEAYAYSGPVATA